MACCTEPATVLKTSPTSKPSELFPYERDASGKPWYGCLADTIIEPRVAKEGVSAKIKPVTLPACMELACQTKGNFPALLVERPCPNLTADNKAPPPLPRESWCTWTLKNYRDEVREVAKGFMSLGFEAFDTVNVWGFNAPEWFMAAIAAMYAGGKVGGLYPTDTPATAAYKVHHSAGVVVCVEDMSKVQKLVSALNERSPSATRIKAFVCWAYEPADGTTESVAGCGDVPVLSWKTLKAKGKDVTDAQLDERRMAIDPGSCASLIYTSGTTGDPKAVMISHDNLVFEAFASFDSIGDTCGFLKGGEERVLSYLPLSHIAGMMMDICGQLVGAAFYPGRAAIFFARVYDLKANSIKDRLSIAQPTVFLGVPLVWEKMADKIRAIGAAGSSTQQKISGFAKGKMLTHARNIQLGGDGSYESWHCVAAKILTKVKGAVGLGSCKFALTGAAPIRVDTLEYYGSLGIFINELYGMSESTGVTTISTDHCHKWGSCGYAMGSTEIKSFKVDPADLNVKKECPRAPDMSSIDDKYQGELCFRGRNIMMGYLANPDFGEDHVASITKKTAETIDDDGWLHSGDKGLISTEGMVKITGRYKELIIGEGGENIAPVPIEDQVKGACDGVNEVMMVGDQRKYNIALITLKAVGANGEMPGTDELDAGAVRLNPKVSTISGAMKDPEWQAAIQKAIDVANNNEKVCPNNAFRIQKFTILPMNFSEQGEELTPTKKLKRKVVETKFAALIDHMYATDGKYIPFQAM